jgi:hypothetical protein
MRAAAACREQALRSIIVAFSGRKASELWRRQAEVSIRGADEVVPAAPSSKGAAFSGREFAATNAPVPSRGSRFGIAKN